MTTARRRWLDSQRHYEGQRPGEMLVAWLNDPQVSQNFVEELLADAQVVFYYLEQYGNLHKLNLARRHKKLPGKFWDCHQRLNEKLATFTHAPRIDLHEVYDGNPVSWTMITEESPIALLSVEVRCILQLIEQGAILKIRRCQQCTKWYFARFSRQGFCSTSCRGKHHAGTEVFRERRRKYMRDYYWLQKSGKVK